MPAIPEITGGAGKGSFNTENKMPTNAPVATANKTSVIVFTFVFAINLKSFYQIVTWPYRYWIKSLLQWHFFVIVLCHYR